MHVKSFKDERRIGRAVRQVVVVVVSLEHVQQHVGVSLTFLTVGHCGLESRIGIDKQRQRLVPIASHQQMGVVPCSTNDLAIGVHFSDNVFRKDLGILVVTTNAIVVVHVKALSNFCNVCE